MSADFGDYMDAPSTSSAASSGSSVGGESFFGFYDLGGSMIQNELRRKAASKQMDFQREMSDTSWQRGVKDMIAAGINPMLAASKGGASSPSGAMSEAESPTHNSAQSAMQAKLLSAQLGKIDAETRNVNAEADRNEQIAGIMKSIGPRIVQGVGAVESAAGSIGSGVAKLEGIIREALKDLPASIRSGVGAIAEEIRKRLTPDLQMPGAVLLDKAKDVVRERSRMPSPVRSHPAWGVGEYERAQAERIERARQSPASRRRSGGK